MIPFLQLIFFCKVISIVENWPTVEPHQSLPKTAYWNTEILQHCIIMRDPGKFILYYMVQDNPDDNTSIFNLVNIGYDQRYLLGSHREEIIALAKLPIHDGHVHTILAYHDPKDDLTNLIVYLEA